MIQIDELRVELDDFESEQNQVFIQFKDAMQILSDDYTKTEIRLGCEISEIMQKTGESND